MRFLIVVLSLLVGQLVLAQERGESVPNLLWFVVDDMSANLSCYGEKTITTPHLDRLAAEGLRFTNAFATAPVCSSSRSAMITGCYQTTIGAHHHRSGRGMHRVILPEGIQPVPALFKAAGYYTCIGSGLKGIDHRGLPVEVDRKGKTDYNFDWDEAIYDSHDWAGRREGQPFFMQVQLHNGKIRGASERIVSQVAERARKEFGAAVDPNEVVLPPYYPRDPVLQRDWAAYLDSVRLTDLHVGQVMERLENEGLLENTFIIFMSDHGISHARGKQFLYDEGTHIPFIIRGPGILAGELREDLIEHIDMAAISLGAAGLEIPAWMQGQDVLAQDYQARDAVYGARDRCGEAADRIRSIRTATHLYIRNYHPQRPLLMPSNYKDSKAIIARLRDLHSTRALPPLSEALLFAPQRPAEELYRWREDHWETINRVDEPEERAVLSELSHRLDDWIRRSHDPGEETPEVYDLEIADQLSEIKEGSERYLIFSQNAEVYRQWRREGK